MDSRIKILREFINELNKRLKGFLTWESITSSRSNRKCLRVNRIEAKGLTSFKELWDVRVIM